MATIESLREEIAQLKQVNNRLIAILLEDANAMDMWATQSQQGGWSTHQVKFQTERANYVRREATRYL